MTSNQFVRVLTIKASNGEEKRMKFPMKLDLMRPKRPRTTFTDEQLTELETAFRENGYLTGNSRQSLAERLGLSDTQVKVWFQNRRTKDRRKPSPEEPKQTSPLTPSTSSPYQLPPQLPTPGNVQAFPSYYPPSDTSCYPQIYTTFPNFYFNNCT